MHEVNLFNIKYCLISLSGTRFYFLRFSNEISRNVNKNIAANVYRGSRSTAPIFLLSLIPELYPCQHIVQHHPSATMMIMCDNMRLCLLFILCYLEFTYSFHRGSHRGSRLQQISDGLSNNWAERCSILAGTIGFPICQRNSILSSLVHSTSSG